MRKRDILTPIGITVGFIMIMIAILSSGGREGFVNFIDIASIFIVIGGLIGSLLINFKSEQIRLFTTVMKESFRKNNRDLPELIDYFINLAATARKEGLLSLENEVSSLDDPFIKKGLMLAIDGVESEAINDIMNAEIVAMEERHYKGRVIIEKAGEYAPSWGMIGTLVGLILMLSNLDDPASLGPNMAVALLTTLYGTVLANLVFLPMAGKLENRTEEEVFVKQIIIEGITGVQAGQSRYILEEKLSAFLYGENKISLKSKSEAAISEEDHVHET